MNVVKVKAKERLLTFVFKGGYFVEANDKFGLNHLTEHCISRVLQKEFNNESVYGSISDHFVSINIDFEEDIDLDKFILVYKEGILKIDRDLVENEKKRIIDEMKNRYDESDQLERSAILKPEELKRDRLDQVKNLEHFNLEDVLKNIKSNFINPITIFITSPNFEDDLANQDYGIEEDIDIKRFVEGKEYQGLFYRLKFKNPQLAYYLLDFVYGITTSIMDNLLYEEGVYSTECFYHLMGSTGYLGHIYKKVDLDVEDKFIEKLKEEIDKEKLFEDFDKYRIDLISDLEKDWDDSCTKIDWIVRETLTYGQVKDLDKIVKELDSVKKEDLVSFFEDIYFC